MKWFFLFFMRGIAMAGPFDSRQECLDALQSNIAQPIIDPGFDHAKASGVCFQGSQPDK